MSFAHRSSFESNFYADQPSLIRSLRERLASLEAGFTIGWALTPLAIALAAALGAFVAM